MKRVLFSAAILATVAVESPAQPASEFGSVPWVDQSGTGPAIIQHGWTSPDTIYLRRNIGELEKRPFTGTVTWISWPRQENGRLWIKALPGDPPKTPLYDLGRRILTRDRLPAEAIEGAIADLKATKFTRFNSNFIQAFFIVAPDLKFDFWFDDELWDIACENFADVARVAKQGGCKGLFIDMETHAPHRWSYVSLREADPTTYDGKSWEQTQSKVRQRGRQVAVALNSQFPDIVLFFTRAYSLINAYGLYPAADLPFNKYVGLYEAFLDGLLEGSTDETILVDGCDNAPLANVDRFAGCRYRALEAPLRTGVTQVPEHFRKKMRVGFGTYLASYDMPWNPQNPTENQVTPRHVQEFVRLGLQFGDGYLWFWNEWSTWWLDGPDAKPADGVQIRKDVQWVPRQYWQAIENGVRDARHWKSHPNIKYFE